MEITKTLAAELRQPEAYIQNVIDLLDAGNTIPFIARYRKEQHGGMDDTTLRQLAERLQYLRHLAQRREEVKKAVAEQEKLTAELEAALDAAVTLAEIEDLYRPYRPKRRTRATAAREKGLAPLAARLLQQNLQDPAPEALAAAYCDAEKGVETPGDALAGASDILAEQLTDDAALRKQLRAYLLQHGALEARQAQEGDSVYRLYYEFSQPLQKLAGHQVLALNRGEREGWLKINVRCDEAGALILLRRHVIRPGSRAMAFLQGVCQDAYTRLLQPSLERELRASLTEMANTGAIYNFALNLRPLLLQPPVKDQVTMGLDPGYRNGCKVAVVDGTGKVLDTTVVYPTLSQAKREAAITALGALIRRHKVQCIAIGNGTASRETEEMTSELIARYPGPAYMVVSEAGASVYSASKLAAEEFPQFDVNLRSAVSIARRLQDPLAELVKIDPRAIGVGQYQHDLPQKELSQALEGVVEDCVNAVGVDLNTASAPLLQQVAGLTAATAKNIVAYREENGAFTSRAQLKKVPKLGPKAFIQCAGFLRIPGGRQILDATGVHPESYTAAQTLLARCGYSLQDVADRKLAGLPDAVRQLGDEDLAVQCGIGVPTLRDIVQELCKPGRDPRQALPAPQLRKDVLAIKDLQPGMVLTGTVRNVIDFGAFVDIGVHQDGLVHISQVSDRFIRHPSELLHPGDVVRVMVLEVDVARKRISLTMKGLPKETV